MAAPSQQVTGLMSGMDTASIVKQLMDIEKQPYDKLDVKKQTEQLRLQAFQAVNTYLLKFRNSVQNLASQKPWNSKAATSTNENSLTASASQYAVNGTYSFRVAQMATATQYMSKGFSDTKATFTQPDSNGNYAPLGSITIANAKTRVDTSAKLESLNGGKGVYRGSIRITDARGNSSNVDLSGCETINDVVSVINNSSGALVKASIGRNDQGESFLQIVDTSNGTGALKVQNVGQGTTAKDLGLTIDPTTQSDGSQAIVGKNLYYMGRDTELSELNDGLGLEEGKFRIYVSNGTDPAANIEVDLNNARTAGDVMDRVNEAIANAANTAAGKGFAGLKMTLNDEKNGFNLTGAKEGGTYFFYNSWEATGTMSSAEIVEQLGLAGDYIADASGVIKGQRILGDVDSPMLKNLSGANASGSGIGSTGPGGQNRVPYSGGVTTSTPVAYLNNGKGLSIGDGIFFKFYENGEDGAREIKNILNNNADLQALIDTDGTTLGQVVDFINNQIQATAKSENMQALADVKVVIKDGGVAFEGGSIAHQFEFNGELASSLGLTRNKNTGMLNDRDNIPSDFQNALDDLYRTDQINIVDGTMVQIHDNTKLTELSAVGEDGAIGDVNNIRTGTDDLIVTIGNKTYNLQDIVDSFDENSTIGDMFTKIGDKLSELAAADGVDFSPYLYCNWTGIGFQWRNIDLGEKFEVSGKFAESLGLNRSYDPSTLAGQADMTITDTPSKDLNPTMPGYAESLYPFDQTKADTITLSQLNGGKGLSLQGEDSDTFDIAFTNKSDPDNPKEYTVSVSKAEIMAEIGSDPANTTVNDYITAVNQAVAKKIQEAKDNGDLGPDAEFTIGLNQTGLMVNTAFNSEKGEIVELKGALVMNGTWGLGNAAFYTEEKGRLYDGLQLSYLNPVEFHFQEVQGIGSIELDIDGATVTLNTDGLSGESTLKDLINKLNEGLGSHYPGISFTMNSAGTGIALDNSSNKTVTIKANNTADTLARDIGLIDAWTNEDRVIEGSTFFNASTLNRKFAGRATSLQDLAGGKTLDLGKVTLTNTTGNTLPMDFSECKTLGDVIDFINAQSGFGIKATLNATGDGISLEEYWAPGKEPAADKRITNIKVADEGSGNLATILGIATTGTGFYEELPYDKQKSSIHGSLNKTIRVSGSDTLESLMNRLSESGFKTAIINDGSGSNPYRLSVSSTNTGAASDFILDTNLEFLGLTQTSRGKDSKVLYGNPDSGVSPIMLSSSTNSNNTAILGLTLDIKQVSDTYTTITVDTDKSKVVDEIKAMADAYNELNDLVPIWTATILKPTNPGCFSAMRLSEAL